MPRRLSVRRTTALLGGVLICGGLFGGCANERDRGHTTRGGSLVIGLPGGVDSWNPYTTNEVTSAGILELIYPRLVRETGTGGDEPHFDPWLARSWKFSDDRLTLTFHLRDDARWSDGNEVTCADVRFTHSVQVADELGWSGAFIKDRIRDVACPDPHTAVFRFTEAYAGQLLDANDDAIVPAAYAEVPLDEWLATAWEERLIGCGPFTVRSVTAGQEAVLERNETWWGASETALDSVVLRVYPDATGILPRLLDGVVDLLPRVPPQRAAEVSRHPDLELTVLPSLSYTYLGWNTLDPGSYAGDRQRRGCGQERRCAETLEDIARLHRDSPHPILADERVRRAMSMAIDRQDLVEGLHAGHARLGTSPIPSALWAHHPSMGPAFDASGAAALLDAAGWLDKDGEGVRSRNGRSFEIRAIVNADNRVRRDALVRVSAGLSRIGVRLIPEPLPRGEFVARARNKDFDVVISGWSAGTRIEPQNLLHSRAALHRGNNLVAWSDDVSDALLDRAALATSREEALPLWLEWQERFEAGQPLTILYEEERLLGLNRRVRAVGISFLNPFRNLHEWSLVSEPTSGS